MVSDGPAGPVHLGRHPSRLLEVKAARCGEEVPALLLYLRPEQLQQKLSDLWTTACRQEEKELDLASALSLSNVSSVQQRMQSELPDNPSMFAAGHFRLCMSGAEVPTTGEQTRVLCPIFGSVSEGAPYR